jgi:hypothetical protein
MSSSVGVQPPPGRLGVLLGLGKEAPGRLQHLLAGSVTIPQSLGEEHPAAAVAGQSQETFPGVTPLGVRRHGELIETHIPGHPGAFHEPKALQNVQGGDDRAAGIPQEARDKIGADEAALMTVQKDQHIPLTERFDTQGFEPAFDLGT